MKRWRKKSVSLITILKENYKGALAGAIFGLLMAALFISSFYAGSKENTALLWGAGALGFWTSFLVRQITGPIDLPNHIIFVIVAITAAIIFGIVGFLLSIVKRRDKHQFKVIMIILLLFYVLLFRMCYLVLTASSW